MQDKWIVREMEKREIGAWTIAKIQDITPRHARRVHKKYKGIKDPKLLPCGRKPREITKEEREAVVKAYREYLVGATMIEQILEEKDIHINHNRIHKILLEEGLAKQQQKKRKWIRYEKNIV